MKKQSIYLPTLNSLFMQDANYRMHRYKLNNCKSTFQNYTNSLSIHNNSTDLLPKQVVLLQNETQSPLRKIKSKLLLKYSTNSPQRKVSQLSPFEKKKASHRESQNQRMFQILKSSKCTGYGRSKTSIENYQVLRDRIRKYIRDGRSINYKFKKSLAEISKRKESIEQHRTENLKASIMDQARKVIAKSQPKSTRRNYQRGNANDIYLQTMRTELRSISTKRQSQARLKTQQSQSMDELEQKSKPQLAMKQAESQKLINMQSNQIFREARKNEARKPLLDYIAQIKIKKKQKLKQKMVIPKSMLSNFKKSKLADLEVVEVQPFQKSTRKDQQLKV